MKKFVIFLFLLINIFLFAEEPVFILKKDLVLEDVYLNEHSFSKGDKFLFDYTKKGFGVDLYNPLSIEIFFKDTNGTSYTSNINDVCLADYDYKICENVSKDYWIPSYYYDLLKSNTPFDDVLKYEKYWANFTFVAEDEPKWYDFFGIQRYYFGDFYIVVFGSDGYKDVDFSPIWKKFRIQKLSTMFKRCTLPVYHIKNFPVLLTRISYPFMKKKRLSKSF